MHPTAEQKAIIDLALTGENIKVQAVAGSGKSSTLRMISDVLKVPSLYLVFNKAMAEEASEKFPEHVEVRTVHSLAYRSFGSKLQKKLARPKGAYRNVAGTGSEIASYLKIEDFKVSDDYSVTAAGVGLAVKDTLARFEASSDKNLSKKHVSFSCVSHLMKIEGFSKSDWIDVVLHNAEMLWKLRINPATEVLATHDTYLKLFQLSEPDLSRYKVIYVDEQQDSSDVMIDIVCRQTGSQIIVVGDSRQAIYGWRGSVDALSKVDYKEMRLSQSFRYGSEVADLANAIIGENLVVGCPTIDTRASFDSGSLNFTQTYTKLFRTNSALITEAVDKIREGYSVSIEIDTKQFLKLLESVLALREGNYKGVTHELVKSFSSFQDLEDSEDSDLQRARKIVLSGKADFIIRTLKTYKKPKRCDIVMTTSHKAKGREWDQVIIAEDFREFDPYNEMEKNLLYVAVTRARKVLVYNSTVLEAISSFYARDSGMNAVEGY